MKHGTRSRYQAGCRCEPCCKANRRYKNAWRKRQAEKKVTLTKLSSLADFQTFETMHGLPVI